FKSRMIPMFVLAIFAFAGLGAFAGLSTREKEITSGTTSVQFDPGDGWNAVAKAFADACGKGGLVKSEVVGAPQRGWIQLRLLSPEGCAGMQVSMPARVIAAPTP